VTAGLKPLEIDMFTAIVADAEGAVFNPFQRLVDLLRSRCSLPRNLSMKFMSVSADACLPYQGRLLAGSSLSATSASLRMVDFW